MKTNLILFLSIFLFAGCVHITVHRLDYFYPKEIERDKNDSNFVKVGIKFEHNMGIDEYFARDTVSDSMYRVYPRYRKEYDKKIGYFQIGRSNACGFNIVSKIIFPDTSLASITEIDYEDARWGIYKFKILFRDTGNIHINFYKKDVMLSSALHVRKDTINFKGESREIFERRKWPFGLLWLFNCWPFCPKFQ